MILYIIRNFNAYIMMKHSFPHPANGIKQPPTQHTIAVKKALYHIDGHFRPLDII